MSTRTNRQEFLFFPPAPDRLLSSTSFSPPFLCNLNCQNSQSGPLLPSLSLCRFILTVFTLLHSYFLHFFSGWTLFSCPFSTQCWTNIHKFHPFSILMNIYNMSELQTDNCLLIRMSFDLTSMLHLRVKLWFISKLVNNWRKIDQKRHRSLISTASPETILILSLFTSRKAAGGVSTTATSLLRRLLDGTFNTSLYWLWLYWS